MSSNVKNIVMRFPLESGGARMFLATMEDGGTVIRDVDNDVVIAEKLFQDILPSSKILYETVLTNMDWGAFSRWVTSREQYSSPFAGYDLESGIPGPGNPERQKPWIETRGVWIDARTPEMIAISADPASGMKFPPASREDMAMVLLAHAKTLDPSDGRSRIAWKIDVSDKGLMFGAPGDGENTDPGMDEAWMEYSRTREWRDAVLEEIGNRAFMSPDCDFLAADNGVVTLESFKGVDMSFGSMREMDEKLTRLGPAIADLLLTVRTADVATDRAREIISDIALATRVRFERDISSPSEIEM